jgi:osmoprotectant transport system permease protein
MDLFGFFLDPASWSGPDGIPVRIAEHLGVSLLAVATAVAVGLPIGVWIGHTGRFASLAINTANIGRALPSYAILAMILPISLDLAAVVGYDPGLGLSFIPTFGAMTLLAIPPVLVNAWAGVREVDRDLLEAGRGMGMRERHILTGIELPIATPVIVGGIRTATLQVIATATIGAIVSFGGLGRYIIDGLLRSDEPRLLAGAILVSGLAIAVDAVLSVVQRTLTPRALRPGATLDGRGGAGGRGAPWDEPPEPVVGAARRPGLVP